jgi:small subunit ribosomal protein S20
VATHKSALKAHKQNLKNREANRQARSRLRSSLKSVRAAVDSGNQKDAAEALRETVALVDRMAGKKIIHRNAAARYKSRLARRLAKSGS